MSVVGKFKNYPELDDAYNDIYLNSDAKYAIVYNNEIHFFNDEKELMQHRKENNLDVDDYDFYLLEYVRKDRPLYGHFATQPNDNGHFKVSLNITYWIYNEGTSVEELLEANDNFIVDTRERP